MVVSFAVKMLAVRSLWPGVFSSYESFLNITMLCVCSSNLFSFAFYRLHAGTSATSVTLDEDFDLPVCGDAFRSGEQVQHS